MHGWQTGYQVYPQSLTKYLNCNHYAITFFYTVIFYVGTGYIEITVNTHR